MELDGWQENPRYTRIWRGECWLWETGEPEAEGSEGETFSGLSRTASCLSSSRRPGRPAAAVRRVSTVRDPTRKTVLTRSGSALSAHPAGGELEQKRMFVTAWLHQSDFTQYWPKEQTRQVEEEVRNAEFRRRLFHLQTEFDTVLGAVRHQFKYSNICCPGTGLLARVLTGAEAARRLLGLPCSAVESRPAPTPHTPSSLSASLALLARRSRDTLDLLAGERAARLTAERNTEAECEAVARRAGRAGGQVRAAAQQAADLARLALLLLAGGDWARARLPELRAAWAGQDRRLARAGERLGDCGLRDRFMRAVRARQATSLAARELVELVRIARIQAEQVTNLVNIE